MRLFRIFLAGIALSLSCVALALNNDVPSCKAGAPESEYAQCLETQVKAQDARLNVAWAVLVKRIKVDFQDSPKVYENLKAAQKAWIQFRDKSCAFETFGARIDSSAENGLKQMCLYRMTRDRALYLETLQYP